MGLMLPAPIFTSCRGRELELARTLEAFHAAWPSSAPPATVVVDSRAPVSPAETIACIADNFHCALRIAVESTRGHAFVLLLEDDVRFAPNFAQRLGVLVEETAATAHPCAFRLYRGPNGVGRQGVVLSRGLCEYVASRWLGSHALGEPRSDRRLFRLIDEAHVPLVYVPLVQHVGRRSTVEGANFHRDDDTEDLQCLDC